MSIEAARQTRATVQEIVDELVQTHRGIRPDKIVQALQVRWTARLGHASPPLDTHKAIEYANHISKGNSVTILAVDAGAPQTRPARLSRYQPSG
jgi:hypothetical protein